MLANRHLAGQRGQMPTRKLATIAIAVCAVATAASYKLYFIREDNGGTVLWNAKEAYFFIPFITRGVHVICLRYPWFLAKEYLGAIERADDEREFLHVVRVTFSGAESYALPQADLRPGAGPSMFTPHEGSIYATCPSVGGGGLCRWAGNHFEHATQEEDRRLGGIGILTNKEIDGGDDGWSKRGFNSG
jgi:hypothetical protein